MKDLRFVRGQSLPSKLTCNECMFFDVSLPEFRLEASSDQPPSWFHFIEDALNFDLLLISALF